ncbi:hypothetical protein DdX_00326 [Ditylenchus destructor]|uniref:Uncharacterized protein n=1 Tax=Ditylenchus destructor TaxID=166010 RepID=A0AAD4RCV3_9BILA|nr:hypothetical protein DdX_00326 [Ditylenchus destructor]
MSVPNQLRNLFMNSEKQPYLILWCSALNSIQLAVNPVAILFLALDRILTIRLGLDYTNRRQTMLVVSDIAAISFIFVVHIGIVMKELPLDMNIEKCLAFSCVLGKSYDIFRYKNIASNCLDIPICLCLFLILRERITSRRNSAIKYTLICEVIFELIPNIITHVVYALDLSIGYYIGVGIYTASATSSLLCAIIYVRIFTEKRIFGKHVVVGTATMVADSKGVNAQKSS